MCQGQALSLIGTKIIINGATCKHYHWLKQGGEFLMWAVSLFLNDFAPICACWILLFLGSMCQWPGLACILTKCIINGARCQPSHDIFYEIILKQWAGTFWKIFPCWILLFLWGLNVSGTCFAQICSCWRLLFLGSMCQGPGLTCILTKCIIKGARCKPSHKITSWNCFKAAGRDILKNLSMSDIAVPLRV